MRTIEWDNGTLKIVDQTHLPHLMRHLYLKTVDDVIDAIKTMKVRGAPAIGVAAAFGCVMGITRLEDSAKRLIAARPTAVNLCWAVERIMKTARPIRNLPLSKLEPILIAEAQKMAEEDVAANKKIGEYGTKLISKGMRILTVCNAGALATVDYGTALGVIRRAYDDKKNIHVYAAETRPRLQGAKLTAWELKNYHIPFTLITDNMIGYHMQKGLINIVITGADRVALNGDSANKIGTYGAAVLAKYHKIPFYIAAPFSTIDFATVSGDDIVIEERSQEEVFQIGCERIAPTDIQAANPSFDVTPAKLIAGIITEKGIIRPVNIKKYAPKKS
ncbi:MAG: S-methyl-5-thioribose-1-phosphate isomerase [Candidatus Margulisiibacteriota bacterium]